MCVCVCVPVCGGGVCPCVPVCGVVCVWGGREGGGPVEEFLFLRTVELKGWDERFRALEGYERDGVPHPW